MQFLISDLISKMNGWYWLIHQMKINTGHECGYSKGWSTEMTIHAKNKWRFNNYRKMNVSCYCDLLKFKKVACIKNRFLTLFEHEKHCIFITLTFSR
jgi:hypothetical protein